MRVQRLTQAPTTQTWPTGAQTKVHGAFNHTTHASAENEIVGRVGMGGQERSEKGTTCRDSLLYPRSLNLMISFNPENDLTKDYLQIKRKKPEGPSLNNVTEVT